MPRRKKVEEVILSPEFEEREKEVVEELRQEKEMELTTFVYGCFPVGYVMPDEEEVE